MILAEKLERKFYVNQEDFVSHIQPPLWHWFILSYLRELLMILHNYIRIDIVFFAFHEQQRNEMIAHLKDQLQEMKAKASMEGKYIRKDAEVRVDVTQKKCQQTETSLKQEREVYVCCMHVILFLPSLWFNSFYGVSIMIPLVS